MRRVGTAPWIGEEANTLLGLTFDVTQVKPQYILARLRSLPAMSLSAVDEHVRPNSTVRECHLYFGARDTELHPGTIILLGADDNADNTTFQTAFSKAQNTTIHGGFYGINTTEAALEYAISVAAAGSHQQLVLRREAIDLRRQKLADMKYHQRTGTHTNGPRAQQW
ncbi:hypothetical protein D9619_002286 [Psilocybe cf. subviscida]|uniref:Uncharacterized protein n=1 Tax=Psilocybe cf. subviscida TaxID=2480587 RepID=A0A8H5F2U4_9AGAR|nr:hypothetical protein D9619_002286 [Psilocybe cf. subviscida]